MHEIDGYITDFYREGKSHRYTGQLSDDFQRALAKFYVDPPKDQCTFYHTMEFPCGEVVPGAWDLRRREQVYLGYVDFSGQRVLELGSATGYLGFYMEAQGAGVVCFDLPIRTPPDIIPLPTTLRSKRLYEHASLTEKLHKSWWYGHAKLNSKNKAVYGDIYNLPDDLGDFDIATLGCILLHLRDPFAALQQAACRTEKAIIVTDVVWTPLEMKRALMEFNPGNPPEYPTNWWGISPGAVSRMLNILGFSSIDIYYHTQKHRPVHNIGGSSFTDKCLFTIVGQRHPHYVDRHPMPESEVAIQAELARQWLADPDIEALNARISQLNAQISQFNAEISHLNLQISHFQEQVDALKSSTSWRLTAPIRLVGRILKGR
ncbi:MAG TPA: hypothetical protein VGQ81_16555 [Acidobacteriota bacterium]|jgi:hypothetical protein|nr:hypothetical protein [Acidobacteriota bacterium]